MGKKLKLGLISMIIVSTAGALYLYIHKYGIAVLQPKGEIASKQLHLIVISTLLMLVVVLPVFWLTFWIAWNYRETNPKPKKYTPNWDHHPLLETIWWGLPCLIILLLANIAWKSSHELDPFKPLKSNISPLKIQAVAMNWKWLFIYPEQGIATVNYIQLPVDRPIDFSITSDGPMNSFWIPSLGGQIYAMAGMNTQLHLSANSTGSFAGSSANLSGRGFAGMRFSANAVDAQSFNDWVIKTSSSVTSLDMGEYHKLAKPSENNPRATYVVADTDIYDKVLMKYMVPSSELQSMYMQSIKKRVQN